MPTQPASAEPSDAESAEWLDFLVTAASRAPSVHNTQPWAFRRAPGTAFDLLADRTRQLPAADPRGRELVLSCGAALYNARLAARVLGFAATVQPLPAADEPDLLARVALGRSQEASEQERRLFAAVPHRHTHRGSFSRGDVPRELLVAMQEGVAAEGARLHLVERPGQRRALSDLVTAADRTQRGDAALQAEVQAWTPAPGETRPDGVPVLVYRPSSEGPPEPFPVRDFGAGRGWGTPELRNSGTGSDPGSHSASDPASDSGSDPTVAVLTTPGDEPLDWLVAGQALQRMLVLAATQWYFAAFYTQPLERPEIRVLVRDEVGTAEFPQMVLRLGQSKIAHPTPRRPVSDILVDEPAGHTDPPGLP